MAVIATQQFKTNGTDSSGVQESDQSENPKTKKASFLGRLIKIIYRIVTFIPGKIWDCIKYICNAIKNSIYDRKVRVEPPLLYQDVVTMDELEQKNREKIAYACKTNDHTRFGSPEHIVEQRWVAEQRLKAAEFKARHNG